MARLHQLVGKSEPGAVDELQHLVLVYQPAGRKRPPPAGADQRLELIDEVDHGGIGALGMIGQLVGASCSRCSANRRRIASTLTGGAISLTLPPRRHTSLINDEEMKTLENEVIRKTVFTDGLSRRFISAIWNSDSKSLITRSPRTIAIAPVPAANSPVGPWS